MTKPTLIDKRGAGSPGDVFVCNVRDDDVHTGKGWQVTLRLLPVDMVTIWTFRAPPGATWADVKELVAARAGETNQEAVEIYEIQPPERIRKLSGFDWESIREVL